MNLSAQDAALFDILNLAQLTLSEEVKKEIISPQVVIKQLLNVDACLEDSGKFEKARQEAFMGCAKLMEAAFPDDNPDGKLFKVQASVYEQFQREMELAKSDRKGRENKQQCKEPKVNADFAQFMKNKKQDKKQDETYQYARRGRNQEAQKPDKNGVAEFISARALSGIPPLTNQQNPNSTNSGSNQTVMLQNTKNNSVRKKFVPPFKKPQVEKAEGSKHALPVISEDPRLKNLDPKMIEMILAEVLDSQSPIRWKDIAGLSFAKKTIYEMIVWPMLRPDIFTGLRSPPKGILLFGPPGTGKTLIGKAIASQSNSTFFSISASSLTSKWVGQSQKMVKTLFMVAKVKQPSVIFIDEIDSLLSARSDKDDQSTRRVKTQFLVQLDGAKSLSDERVLIIGATNRPDELDDAVRRRFVKKLYIPLPNKEGRMELFKNTAKNSVFRLSQSDIQEISLLTKGFSGADLHNLCTESSMIPIRRLLTSITDIPNEEVPPATIADLKEALSLVRPTVNSGQLSGYLDWNKNYGSYQFSCESELDS